MKLLRFVSVCLLLSGAWISPAFGDDYNDTTPIDPVATKDVRIKKWPDSAQHNDGTYGWWIAVYNFTSNPVKVHLKAWQLRTDPAGNPVTQGSFDDKWTTKEIDLDLAGAKTSGNIYVQHFKPDTLEFKDATVTLPGQVNAPAHSTAIKAPPKLISSTSGKFSSKGSVTSTPVAPPNAPATYTTKPPSAQAPSPSPTPGTQAPGPDGHITITRPPNMDNYAWTLRAAGIATNLVLSYGGITTPKISDDGKGGYNYTGLTPAEISDIKNKFPEASFDSASAPPATAHPYASAEEPTAASANENPTKKLSKSATASKSEPPHVPHDGYWFDEGDKGARNKDPIIYIRINGKAERVPLSVAKKYNDVPSSAMPDQMTQYSEKDGEIKVDLNTQHSNNGLAAKNTNKFAKSKTVAIPGYWFDPNDNDADAPDPIIYVRINGVATRVPLSEAEGYGVPKSASLKTMTWYNERQGKIVKNPEAHTNRGK